MPPLLEAADAEGATILCIYGSNVHLSGIAGRLNRYQFVNSPKKPLQSLSKSARESVYKKLTISVENANFYEKIHKKQVNGKTIKGYSVITKTIPEEITPKNRLLMAHPQSINI